MRSRFAIAGAALALVAFAAIYMSAALASSEPQEVKRLRFGVDFSPFSFIDIGAEGPSQGDETVFDDVLLSGGQRAGIQRGYCVVIRFETSHPNPFKVECTLTVRLDDGQITAQGLTTNAAEKQLAITGGTGAYQDAGGQLTLVEFGNGRGSLTLRLIP